MIVRGALTRLVAALAAVLIAAAALVFALPSRGGAGPSVSIKVPNKQLDPGDGASIRGELRSSDGATYTMDFYESPWPYRTERLIHSMEVSGSDSVGYEVRPKFNTRYRVQLRGLPETSTRDKVLWVGARKSSVDIRFLNRRKGRIKTTMLMNVSPKLPYDFGGRTLRFYFWEKGTNRIVPKARSRTKVTSPGRVRGSATFRIPTDHRYRFYVTWCFDTERKDIGVGKPQPKKCPRRTVSPGAFGKLAAADHLRAVAR